MNEQEREYHPVAGIFPLLQGSEYKDLKNDIATNGLLEAIWLHPNGSIIDGRNRHRACIDSDTRPHFREWNGAGSLVALIISLNLARRHLSSSQRAALSPEIKRQIAAEIKEEERLRIIEERKNRRGETCKKVYKSAPRDAGEETAKIIGTNKPYVHTAEKLEEKAPDLLEEVKAGTKTIKRAKQELKQREKRIEVQTYSQQAMTLSALDKVYNVIYADPPWKYTTGGGSNTLPGVTDSHYATMDHADICNYLNNIGIKKAPDSVLFLWVTNPFLELALEVVKAWGFKYKTNIAWRKTELQRVGVGYYVRGQHELLYICTRGSFTPLDKNISPPISSVLEAPLGEHSAKPPETYDIIETLYPDCTYIELFARNKARHGWEVLGNEA